MLISLWPSSETLELANSEGMTLRSILETLG